MTWSGKKVFEEYSGNDKKVKTSCVEYTVRHIGRINMESKLEDSISA